MATRVSRKIFHSKLLLFGEHIINRGARGLAVPLSNYNGCFRFDTSESLSAAESNKSLELLANYIIYHTELDKLYDTNALLEDVERGLYFDSNIPQGYGLGSSGALVAAVYFQYKKAKKKNTSLSDLKRELAALESYFHGKSSGIDAIVCYLNKAVLLDKGEVSEAFSFTTNPQARFKVFLLNTRIARQTSPYVNKFLESCKNRAFLRVVEKSLVPSTNIAISSLLNSKYSELWKSVKIISQLHLDILPDFIPNQFHELWLRGLLTNQYALKICGAGGGGFIIGFAPADSDYKTLLAPHEVVEVMSV